MAGLDSTASLKPSDSQAKTVALSSGGSMQGLHGREGHAEDEAAHIAARAALVRSEQLEPAAAGSRLANDIVDLLVTTRSQELNAAEMKKGGVRLANDLADLLNKRDISDPASIDEVRKACSEAKALLAARVKSRHDGGLTNVLLATGNISAETLAAEADPCQALNDRLNNAMEGHTIVDKNGHRIEVPLTDETVSPLSEEEQQLKKAVTVFLSSCAFVGVCMIFIFIITLVMMNKKKKKAKEDAKARAEASQAEASAVDNTAVSAGNDDDPDF